MWQAVCLLFTGHRLHHANSSSVKGRTWCIGICAVCNRITRSSSTLLLLPVPIPADVSNDTHNTILTPRCRSTDPLPTYPTPNSKPNPASRAASPFPPASQESVASTSAGPSSQTAPAGAAMLQVPSSTSLSGRNSSPAPMALAGTNGATGVRSGGYTVGPEKGTGGSTGVGSGSGRPDAQGNVFFDCLVCGRAVRRLLSSPSYSLRYLRECLESRTMSSTPTRTRALPGSRSILSLPTAHGSRSEATGGQRSRYKYTILMLTRQTASNRYAPHLSSCLGLSGSTRRGATRARPRAAAGAASTNGSGGLERSASPYVGGTPSEAGDSDDGASVSGKKTKSTSMSSRTVRMQGG